MIIVSVYMVSADSRAPLLTPLRHTGVVIIASVYMVSADSTAPLLTPMRHTGAHTGARGTLGHCGTPLKRERPKALGAASAASRNESPKTVHVLVSVAA